MRSKALKHPWKDNKSKNIIQKFLDRVWDIFVSKPIWFIKNKYRALVRFIEYGRLGWRSYDWDYSYFLTLLKFKLQRIEKALQNSFCEQEKNGLQSVRICIKLLDRLIRDDYSLWKNLHYKKWGHPDFDFVEESVHEKFGTLYQMVDNRHSNMTADQIEQERKEYIIALKKDEDHTKRDSRLLFSIMEKYYTWWWD